MSKFNHIRGLTGYQIKVVLNYSIGDCLVVFRWNDKLKNYEFFIPDKKYNDLLATERGQKILNHFNEFWLGAVVRPHCEFEG